MRITVSMDLQSLAGIHFTARGAKGRNFRQTYSTWTEHCSVVSLNSGNSEECFRVTLEHLPLSRPLILALSKRLRLLRTDRLANRHQSTHKPASLHSTSSTTKRTSGSMTT